MPRAVLDVNVLVSALVSAAGTPARLLLEWRAGAFELVVSEALLRELESAFAKPGVRTRVEDDEVRELIALLRNDALLMADPEEIEPVVPRDPGDDYLVALARAASADVIVTGDRHLLEVEGLAPRAATPGRFLALLLTLE